MHVERHLSFSLIWFLTRRRAWRMLSMIEMARYGAPLTNRASSSSFLLYCPPRSIINISSSSWCVSLTLDELNVEPRTKRTRTWKSELTLGRTCSISAESNMIAEGSAMPQFWSISDSLAIRFAWSKPWIAALSVMIEYSRRRASRQHALASATSFPVFYIFDYCWYSSNYLAVFWRLMTRYFMSVVSKLGT